MSGGAPAADARPAPVRVVERGRAHAVVHVKLQQDLRRQGRRSRACLGPQSLWRRHQFCSTQQQAMSIRSRAAGWGVPGQLGDPARGHVSNCEAAHPVSLCRPPSLRVSRSTTWQPDASPAPTTRPRCRPRNAASARATSGVLYAQGRPGTAARGGAPGEKWAARGGAPAIVEGVLALPGREGCVQPLRHLPLRKPAGR